jgi:CheY-like chemotaxis protein
MSPRKVMIVEDEADCAMMLELALETLPGIVAIRVATAEAAIQSMQQQNVAAVISDIHLGAMSGIELIGRAHAINGGIPVVIVSASADAGVRGEALRAGAAAFSRNHFLQRPFATKYGS